MDSRIHLSQIWKLMEERDRLGKPKPFSFQYAKKSGELETYRNATLSSIYSKGATVNIMVEEPLAPKGGLGKSIQHKLRQSEKKQGKQWYYQLPFRGWG